MHTPNVCGTPIVEIPLADADDLDVVSRLLWDSRHLRHARRLPPGAAVRVGFRVQMTAANSDEEVDELLTAITDLADRSLLRKSSAAARRAAG